MEETIKPPCHDKVPGTVPYRQKAANSETLRVEEMVTRKKKNNLSCQEDVLDGFKTRFVQNRKYQLEVPQSKQILNQWYNTCDLVQRHAPRM